MRPTPSLSLILLLISPLTLAQQPREANPPRDWIDPDTGHRIVRLSDEPGSRTLYFHDNAYTPEGDKLIFNTPAGIAAVDVAKIGTPDQKLETISANARGAIMSRRSRELYIVRGGGRGFGPRGQGAATRPATLPADTPNVVRFPTGGPTGTVYAIHIDTKKERQVSNATNTLINCDETYAVSVVRGDAALDPTGQTTRPAPRPYVSQLQRMFPGKKLEDLTPDQQYSVNKEEGLARMTLNPPPAALAFTNLKTGERKIVGHQFANPNHLQFNPRDPSLLLFAHEGTWHEVDRTWTIRTDGSQMKLMHRRTMDMEINGHEWWSWDGKTVWFDLQTPRSEKFWIAGVNVHTGKQTRYPITRDTWGVHFNSSRDDTLFASDGGDPSQVAYSTDGMWINLFRVQPDGTLKHERLVSMRKHNYVTGGGRAGVEPNNSITPDNKWVVFTAEFTPGQRHVYAVATTR